MGSRTRDEIIMEGQIRGGRDDLSSVLEPRLNDWLDRAGSGWSWPLLTFRRTIPVGTGVNSVTVGEGAGGIANRVVRLAGESPWLYTANLTTKVRLSAKAGNSSPEELWVPPNTNGVPSSFILTQPSLYTRSFVFNQVTNGPYVLFAVLVELPPRLTGNTVPWYPEDETMIAYIESEVLRRENGVDSPSYMSALEDLNTLQLNDRIRHGYSLSANATWDMDSTIHRG
jgi:hypothetical protein